MSPWEVDPAGSNGSYTLKVALGVFEVQERFVCHENDMSRSVFEKVMLVAVQRVD